MNKGKETLIVRKTSVGNVRARAVASVEPGGGARPPPTKVLAPPYLAQGGIYKVFKYSKIINFLRKIH